MSEKSGSTVARYLGPRERMLLMSVATDAASAATEAGGSTLGFHYATCAAALLRAAIGDAMTLEDAVTLLERWNMAGTPLERRFYDAVSAIRERRDESSIPPAYGPV